MPDAAVACMPAKSAADAEALMRSRYSAFARGLADYLLATWHASTRYGCTKPAASCMKTDAGTTSMATCPAAEHRAWSGTSSRCAGSPDD